ncbi:arf-GAP with coiled-coil, ANK repeat and PH domain-containing protein 3-like isoform X2 [Rhopilema esculentum]|uniref:arf-GAP with coiled-coil, ANK repeat and PH domain-containing protein 3-like isoform X2 n=1 Tax=Rhopilema esculentum TaxID=499914 RepID=UPI0031E0867C
MKPIPSFEFILEDSPVCHQSLKYWNQKSKEVRKGINLVATNLDKYHSTGLNHKIAGDGLSDALSSAAKVFRDDKFMEEPLNRFSDAVNRIECYREMLLNQTSMLGVQPLMDIAKYIKKAKELKHQVTKANETLHLAWDKFSSIPNQKNLQEPGVLDKAAHVMLNAKENYQQKLAKYIQVLREIHTVKKLMVLRKVLEHMLAQYSFFNFSYQVLKETEPYMTEVFDSLTKQLEKFEIQVKDDISTRDEIMNKIEEEVKMEKRAFPEGAGHTGSSAMHAINASTGRFFTKFGGMIASGVQGVRGKTSKDGPTKPEPDWEVIDEPSKKVHSDSVLSKEEQTGFVSNAGELDDGTSKGQSKSSQFYLSIDEASNNVVVKSADQLGASMQKPSEDGTLTDAQVEEHHRAMNDDSVVSLTDLLEAASQDEAVSRPRADSVDPHYKKGYLRIKQKGTIRNRYPLVYIIVDKKQGNILAQGDDQEEADLLTNLTLSTVKECVSEETDRNFCFQIITATKEFSFQAHSAQNMKEWMQAIQEGVGAALNLSQERIRTLVRSKTQREAKLAKAPVVQNAAERIRAVEGNKECADCSAPRPDWASTNLGVVFCIECSGMHRGMGVHISKVKSLTLDRWHEDLVKHMEERGNARVNKVLEGKIGNIVKPTRNSSKDERRNFILAKYVNRRFAIPSNSDEVDLGDEPVDSDSSTEDFNENLSNEDCEKQKVTMQHGGDVFEDDLSSRPASKQTEDEDDDDDEKNSASEKSSIQEESNF